MMEKKYKLTKDTIQINEKTLYRIKSLRDFGNVKKGQLGGYIESEKNLSHFGNCWVYDNACVFDSALVSSNAQIHCNAKVYDYALVLGNSYISGNAHIFNHSSIGGDTVIIDNVKIYDKARVNGHAKIVNDSHIRDSAHISEYANISGNSDISKQAVIGNKTHLHNAQLSHTNDCICVSGIGTSCEPITFYRSNNEIYVKDIIFYGVLSEFRQYVINTYKDSIIVEEYLDLASLVEKRFRNR